jgi:hypothetical protein
VQDVALQVLGVQGQLAQAHGLLGNLDAQGVLRGLDGGELVADGADAADARDDLVHLTEVLAQDHGLEEARGFGHLPAAGGDLALGVYFDHDVAVAFHAADVLDLHPADSFGSLGGPSLGGDLGGGGGLGFGGGLLGAHGGAPGN